MSDIPNNILLQILSWVPAKSLFRLRWTCKYWFDLITKDHDFTKMHLLHYHSTQSMITTVSFSVLISSKEDGNTEKLFKSYLNYNTREAKASSSSSQVRIAFPFESYRAFNVLGSCNGLILINTISSQFHERTMLWNPCTNEYQVIHGFFGTFTLITSCLGYDSTTDDYKVIRIIQNGFHCNNHYDLQVYTLGTNSWISTLHLYGVDLSFDNGVFVNGALYWLHPEKRKIFSYDIANEKFQEVPVSVPREWKKLQILVFEGSLCLVLTNACHVNPRTEMWIMNKHYDSANNDKCSWTKLYTYTTYNEVLSTNPNLFRPLRYTNNGEILMLKNDRYLCLSGTNNDRAETFRTICDPCCSVKEVYIESLISLKSGTYLHELET